MSKSHNTVVADLQATLEIAPEVGETQQEFAERLFTKANAIPDEDWGTLEQETQKWVNEALEATTAKKAVPLPSGIGEVIVAAPEGEPTPEEKVVSKKSVKKPAAKKAKKPTHTPAVRPATAKRPGPKGKIRDEVAIKILAKENPHRKTAKDFGKFAKIKGGMTVAAAIKAGVDKAYLRYSVRQGFISVSN